MTTPHKSFSLFFNTTALAEIGCLHQRLWRYNLVVVFLFRFINFCFLVYVTDSQFSWRVWQRPTTTTRGYTYIYICSLKKWKHGRGLYLRELKMFGEKNPGKMYILFWYRSYTQTLNLYPEVVLPFHFY